MNSLDKTLEYINEKYKLFHNFLIKVEVMLLSILAAWLIFSMVYEGMYGESRIIFICGMFVNFSVLVFAVLFDIFWNKFRDNLNKLFKERENYLRKGEEDENITPQ